MSFGYCGASPALMALCAQRGVALSFLTENGFFLARVTGGVHGNVLLRRKQYRTADAETESLKIASAFILAKVANCRTALLRAARDHEEAINTEKVLAAAHKLSLQTQAIENAESVEMLRGIEGDAAKIYFGVFDQLILTNKKDFFLYDRNRRPPLDNMNALLSFLYTLLTHDVQAALETVGLDPAVGFLHAERPGRPSLALDLMEPLRPVIADSVVITAINTGMVSRRDFETAASGCAMNAGARKAMLRAYEARLDQLVTHPAFDYRCSWRSIIRLQARLLARWLRDDIPEFTNLVTR